MEIELTDKDFDEVIKKSDKTVLVDFWAAWCGPCRMLAPIVAQIAEERSDILVAKVNVDDAIVTAMMQKVSAIPTLKVFKNGECTATQVGLCTKDMIFSMLEG